MALASLLPTSVLADYSRSQKWFNSLSDWERRGIQTNLILTGFYAGFVDARFGRNTYEALVEFEGQHSFFANGVLSQIEAGRLVRLAEQWRDAMQFRDERDRRAGVSIPIPHALTGGRTETDRGAAWEGNSGLRIETSAFALNDVSMELLFALFSDPSVSPGVKYRSIRDDFFVVSGQDAGSKYYFFFKKTAHAISGFSVHWLTQIDDVGSRVAVYLASKATYFSPFAPPPPLRGQDQQESQKLPPKADSTVRRQFSGSGFFVSATGLILTNYHVVEHCASIKVSRFGSAELLRYDPSRDLATILVDRPSETQPTATFDGMSPTLGSSVVLGGFPLSDLFASDFTVAFGSVTGRRGIAGNEMQFSISAPVQPGNSGGPVVNEHGRIVGITVGKLNDAKMMEATGSTGANFGFAIDAAKIEDFLRPFVIEERSNTLLSGDRDALYDNETLAQILESYSVQITCEAAGD